MDNPLDSEYSDNQKCFTNEMFSSIKYGQSDSKGEIILK